MRFILLLAVLLSAISCKEPISETYVKSKMWSYIEGFKIGKGDIVLFETKERIFDMKGDTIYYEGKPRAIIKKINKKTFTMKVKSIVGNETGVYRNTEESLE